MGSKLFLNGITETRNSCHIVSYICLPQDVICLQEIRLPAFGPAGACVILLNVRKCKVSTLQDTLKRAGGNMQCTDTPALSACETGCRKNDGEPRDRGAVRVELAAAASAAERKEVQTIACALREAVKALPDYRILMSLADWKYSGINKSVLKLLRLLCVH